MFCDETLEHMERIAAGEMAPDGRIAAHLASCRDCAAALEDARRVDHMLQARPVPRPSAQFTPRTMARIRRARWRSEQYLDVGFNLVMCAAGLAVIGGLWFVFERTGLGAVSNDAMDLFGDAVATLARRIVPSLPLYGGAAALLAMALGIWWWAEKDAIR